MHLIQQRGIRLSFVGEAAVPISILRVKVEWSGFMFRKGSFLLASGFRAFPA